tara:strand:- start:41 stop:979 length:939 start_codon:yes stop_codon:yes gene_type:complete
MDICIIKPNSFNKKLPKKEKLNYDVKDEPFNETDYKKKINNVDIKKFKEDTKDFIEFRKIKTDLMIDIEDIIEADQKYACVTNDICFNYKNLYHICFVDRYHENLDKTNLNWLGTLLNTEDKVISGSVVILKMKTPVDNFSCELSSIDWEDIAFLINSRYFHAGVLIKETGKLEQIYFNDENNLINMDKANSLNTSEHNCINDKNYEGYKHTIFNLDLNIFVRKPDTYEEKSLRPNHAVSHIFQMRVEGDSLLIGKDLETNIYYDIFVEDIANILKLYKERKLTVKETKEERDDNHLKIFKSPYRIMYNRLH